MTIPPRTVTHPFSGTKSAVRPLSAGISGAAPVLTPRVQRGELWQLGTHRLLCGDSRDPAQVQKLMQGERAVLTITSPPYNIGQNAALAGNRALGHSKYLRPTDAQPHADYLALLEAVTTNALAVSDIVILNVQMLAGNKVALLELLHRFRHELIDIAVWDKGYTAPAMAKNVMNSRFELLVFLTTRTSKGKTPRTLFTADFRGTVDNVYQGRPQKHNPYFAVHAATFPLHLPLWLIQTFNGRGGSVFDPFIGTGTTLMAAEQTSRRCYGIELEPVYCDILLSRWETETSRKAQCLQWTS